MASTVDVLPVGVCFEESSEVVLDGVDPTELAVKAALVMMTFPCIEGPEERADPVSVERGAWLIMGQSVIEMSAAVFVSKDFDVYGNLMFVQSFVTLGILLD